MENEILKRAEKVYHGSGEYNNDQGHGDQSVRNHKA